MKGAGALLIPVIGVMLVGEAVATDEDLPSVWWVELDDFTSRGRDPCHDLDEAHPEFDVRKIDHEEIAYYWQPLDSEQEEGETIEARRVAMPGLCGLNRIIDGYDDARDPCKQDWDVPPTTKKIFAGHTVYLAGTMTVDDGAPLLRINVPNTSAESYLELRGDVPGAPGGIIDILPDAEPPGQLKPICFTQYALGIGSPFTRVSSLRIWRQIGNASEVETGCTDNANLYCVGVDIGVGVIAVRPCSY